MDTILTLDYELYNGLDSGTVQNCMITPTEKLMEVLDKYGFKATFFVDTVFLNRLRSIKGGDASLEKDWTLIVDQLRKLSANGHDLQLHIHPQWYRATYSDGKWHSVIKDYKLSDMTHDEVYDMFSEGVNLLKEITGKSPVAYRAGAFSAQTYKELSDTLKHFNLCIDSSVKRGCKSITKEWQWFDYTNIPESFKYKFSSDITVRDDSGTLTELSLPSYKISRIGFIWQQIIYRLSSVPKTTWGDGSVSIGRLGSKKDRVIFRFNYYLKKRSELANIDGIISAFLPAFFKQCLREKKDYFLIIGHPKSFSEYSLMQLDNFLSTANNRIHNKTVSSFAVQ